MEKLIKQLDKMFPKKRNELNRNITPPWIINAVEKLYGSRPTLEELSSAMKTLGFRKSAGKLNDYSYFNIKQECVEDVQQKLNRCRKAF